MDYYFNFIPGELLEVVISYMEDFKSIFNLYELSDYTRRVITPDIFKRLLSEKIGDLIKSTGIDFTENIPYLISSYVRAIKTYKETKEILNHMINEFNRIIKTYFPDQDIYNFDEEGDYETYNIINHYSFEMNKINMRFSSEIMNYVYQNKINNQNNKLEYINFLKDYSKGKNFGVVLLINQNGLQITANRLSNENDYFHINVTYDEMLYVMFYLNYQNDIEYIRNGMNPI